MGVSGGDRRGDALPGGQAQRAGSGHVRRHRRDAERGIPAKRVAGRDPARGGAGVLRRAGCEIHAEAAGGGAGDPQARGGRGDQPGPAGGLWLASTAGARDCGDPGGLFWRRSADSARRRFSLQHPGLPLLGDGDQVGHHPRHERQRHPAQPDGDGYRHGACHERARAGSQRSQVPRPGEPGVRGSPGRGAGLCSDPDHQVAGCAGGDQAALHPGLGSQ